MRNWTWRHVPEHVGHRRVSGGTGDGRARPNGLFSNVVRLADVINCIVVLQECRKSVTSASGVLVGLSRMGCAQISI
jgi:hypothetical protein